jgi:hypothetical protein
MPTTVVFGNASDAEIILAYKDDTHKVVELRLAKGAQAEVKNLLNVHFSIKTMKSTQNYERASVPESYIQSVGFGPFMKRVVKAELENDGCVYIVKSDDDHSMEKSFQPPGFPLCPSAP